MEDYLPCGYRLFQDNRFFKLGQDSVRLAAFAAPPKGAAVCDLGCGTGVLSLLLLGKDPGCHVTGVELQTEVLELAEQNRTVNGLSHRFRLVLGDVRNIRELLPGNSFDYVIANPPYFAEGSGHSAQNPHKKIARQENCLTLPELAAAAAYLLRFGGKFAMVYRPERLCDVTAALREQRLEPKRLQFLHGSPNKEPSAVLVESRYGSAPGCRVLPPLFTDGRNG